jgi:glycosyltransferase involved in cell wall biosynthesis
MKILCVIDSLGSGGAQRQLVNLSIEFKKRGLEVSFLVYHSINFYKAILSEHNIPVHEIIEGNYLKRIFSIRRFIRSGEFDSVLSFLEASNFICEIAGLPRRKWKLVVGERSANPTILKSCKLRAFRWFHIFADYVVANSYENLKLVRKTNPLLSTKKCHVIYNIIDFEKWKPHYESYKYKNNEKFNLIVVASHQYLKNLDGLIEAVALLDVCEKESLMINWYGGARMDNSKEEALKKIEIKGLKKVFNFHNPIADIQYEINKADALGLFSFYEGLPNTICEAMAMGKPVLSTMVSDIPLLISNANLLSDPLNSNSISKSLKFVLKMSQNELLMEGEINRRRAMMLFNSEIDINKYLVLLKH